MPFAPTRLEQRFIPVQALARDRAKRPMHMRCGKICFVAHTSYGEMAGGGRGDIGGIQRQQSLMARWLAARGWDVNMLTWDEGQPKEVVHDGVRVLKLCRRDAGLPGLRFLLPRWTSLLGGLQRADAEIYYHNSAEYVTGQVALWCRRHGRRFVYSAASDPASEARLPTLRSLRERILYRYGIRHADGLIVQTRKQQSSLRAGFGLDSMVLPMPCVGPAAEAAAAPTCPSPPFRVIWVGRISPEKRLEWLLDIAQSLPDIRFEVAGRPDSDEPELLARAATVPNVSMLGAVARERMPDVYRGALCLLNTSSFEGFPNTFLEAWSQGVPVVATVDPDELIERDGLGITAQTRDGLADAIRSLMNRDCWQAASSRARAYFLRNHAVDAAMARFEHFFQEIIRQPRSSCTIGNALT